MSKETIVTTMSLMTGKPTQWQMKLERDGDEPIFRLADELSRNRTVFHLKDKITAKQTIKSSKDTTSKSKTLS